MHMKVVNFIFFPIDFHKYTTKLIFSLTEIADQLIFLQIKCQEDGKGTCKGIKVAWNIQIYGLKSYGDGRELQKTLIFSYC